MADAIPAANADLLAAQAKSGMEGVAAYQQAQQTLAQQRQTAVQTAMQEAALRGAPAGAMQSQAGIISTPYDQRIASLAQAQAGFQGDMAARDRRMADYNAATLKARELIPGEVEKIVAPIRAQGEATIANTTRQGEMAVSEIEARTRLALAQMAADAARAARAAAAAKAAANKPTKLSGTDLEAMLTKEVMGSMGTSVPNLLNLVRENERKSKAAYTGDESQWGEAAPEARKYADARQAQIVQQQRNRMQAENEGYQGVVTQGSKPVAPTRRPGEPPEAFQVRMQQYQQQMSGWQNTQSTSPLTSALSRLGLGGIGTVINQMSSAAGDPQAAQKAAQKAAQAQAQALAKQRAQESLAPLLGRQSQAGGALDARLLSLYGARNSPAGFVSGDQLAWIQNTDPFLAAVIANSPQGLTQENIGSLVMGEPDDLGQPSPYSMQVLNMARQLGAARLRGAGYDISDEDLANATTTAMKPGESMAQYMARISGQMSSQDKVKQYREDARFQAWLEDREHDKAMEDYTDEQIIAKHNQFVASTDENGLPRYDPDTGLPVTDSPAKQNEAAGDLADEAATSDLLTYLPFVPDKAKFGRPTQVAATIRGPQAPDGSYRTGDVNGEKLPLWIALYTQLADVIDDPTGVGSDDFQSAINDNEDISTAWGYMTPAQKRLLMHYFYDESKN